MKIDVKHIAELSKIALKKEELDRFTPEMKTILNSVSILKDLNTEDVQPAKKHIPFSELREDTPKDSLSQKDVLKNAKYKENGCVKIFGKIFGDIEES
jgi:aspartyl-tRNA(Asn)/glutamyl-tRNA(Gln) amidotransferase subunit C